MEREILMKNLVYLTGKERALDQLKMAQVRRIAAGLREKLREMPLIDRESVGDLLRSFRVKDLEEEALTAELCREIVKQMPELTPALFFPAQEEAEGKLSVSYMRNAHSDRAFAAFAAQMPGLAPSPAVSHADCCEDVFEASADACILPLSTGKDGILTSFCALAEQHELAVSAVTRIEMPQAGDHTIFALMKRRCEFSGHATFFAFAIHEDFLPQMGEILSTVQALGGRLTKIDAVPVGKESPGFLYLIVADVAHAELTAFLLYLEIAAPSYLAFGLFDPIEA